MRSAIVEKLRAVRSGLTHVREGERLSRAALAIVLLLDVFVLFSIFDGLEAHTRQLATPWERVPAICRAVVLEGRWNAAARLDQLAAAVPEYPGVPERGEYLHRVCATLAQRLAAVERDPDLRRLLADRRRVDQEVRDLAAELATLTPAYDTSVLERVATPPRPGRPDVAAIRTDVDAKTRALDAVRARRGAIDAALGAAPAVTELWRTVDATTVADRDRLCSDLRGMTFWWPAKRLGMQLLFLVPLVAAFWTWNSASLRRRRGLQTLVSAHLLVVAAIPLLVEGADAVYDVLPKRLLARLLRALEALRLVAIWHYLVIAAAIAAALLLVVVVQRKLFSRERQVERRISKGLCQDCGKRLPAGARACPFCGTAQVCACERCGGERQVHAGYCQACGAKAA
jgi:hypothetical protein